MTSVDERWSDVEPRVSQRYFGKYHGFVYENEDPKQRGRLRLIVPEVLGEVPSGWAEPCFPYGGGKNFGNFDVPPITRGPGGSYTTGVWVEFRHGNPQYPIWVGCFFGAPGGEPEAPGTGDEDKPDIETHVYRTFSGHSITAVDKSGEESFEFRDTAGQSIKFEAPLREGVKRDDAGTPQKPADAVDYGDLVADEAHLEITDFAGNKIRLDGRKTEPTILIKNTDRDNKVLQTIELVGSPAGPTITIRDDSENVITMDRAGIRIESTGGTDRIVMTRAGIAENAPTINLNSGVMGAARLNDVVASTMTTDPTFWTWMSMLMTWLAGHTHQPAGGITTPPTVPFPGTIPSTCIGKIVSSSKTVVIGE